MTDYKYTARIARRPAGLLLICSLFCLLSLSVQAQHVYYRYVNKNGVKVLDHSIPPEYSQGGYEVINAAGKVIKVVPPAPSADEIARNAKEREILETYARLKRRYSSIDAMEAYKQRQLKSIQNNIGTLNGIIRSLQIQVDNTMSKAADFERRGKAVPESVLSQLNNLNIELDISKELLAFREKEHQDVINRFDSDILAFMKGEALEKMSKEKID